MTSNTASRVPQTRMMAQKKSPEGIQYSGFFDALIKIPRQEGIMAMYKVRSSPFGVGPRVWYGQCVP